MQRVCGLLCSSLSVAFTRARLGSSGLLGPVNSDIGRPGSLSLRTASWKLVTRRLKPTLRAPASGSLPGMPGSWSSTPALRGSVLGGAVCLWTRGPGLLRARSAGTGGRGVLRPSAPGLVEVVQRLSLVRWVLARWRVPGALPGAGKASTGERGRSALRGRSVSRAAPLRQCLA